ncbi:replication endonuclease [Acidovorax sp. SUPP2825]|uniref:replication endonuclease n=1 Tax=Acidovorax sp. SUPP2825 TaxID=2920879 RepID=UPI0023DE445B|nr:replication endonuclease [Acidovorax sp. SUPP2825]GKS96764.1 bacteriophage replication protein [Acidovorax sp. SUPP2825]
MTSGRASRNYYGSVEMTQRIIRINTQVARWPNSWRDRLRERLGRMSTWPVMERWAEMVGRLTEAERGGLRPDASDSEVCAQADITARDFHRRLGLVAAVVRGRERAVNVALRLQAFAARHLLAARGLLDLWVWRKPAQRAAAVARMCCPMFWRRAYRKLLCRTRETVAVSIGMVRKGMGLYCSDDALRSSRAQDARCAAVLESVVAVNDHMQAYKLAELAATGVSNQAIRRQELLTRIAGFELIAKDLGHWACMVTVTCASRFHAATTRKDGRVVDNPRYEELSPRDGQQNLSLKWSRCRAAAARLGLEWYGFRIAEPQHDGTPHWHVLLFMPRRTDGVDAFVVLQELVRRYFLDCDEPHEPGAQKHRVDFELIDWAKGSAVGYVIKYISKNIDGHGVDYDLYGEPAIASSQRVRAWAKQWRIRQFQQVGGPPVGVWRELRRVHPDKVPDSAPAPLREAISAMNVAKVEPGVQSLAWKKYALAQGGVNTCRKALRIKLIKEVQGGKTRYGEARPDRPVGVWSEGVECFRNHIHVMNPAAPDFQRRVLMQVESERAEWLMGGRGKAEALAVAAVVFQRSGAAASTRIHVNNCTRVAMTPPPSDFAPRYRRIEKMRVFRRFEAAPGRPPGNQKE